MSVLWSQPYITQRRDSLDWKWWRRLRNGSASPGVIPMTLLLQDKESSAQWWKKQEEREVQQDVTCSHSYDF